MKKQSKKIPHNLFTRFVSCLMIASFLMTSIIPPTNAQAQTLPAIGAMIQPTPSFMPPIMHGLTLHSDNPLKFDFIIDSGDVLLDGEEFRAESMKLVKYFLAALTVPEEDMWVNLSPHEKDRVIPEGFGATEMGRDLLAQDYLLKQLTASLMHPDRESGKMFWKKIFGMADQKAVNDVLRKVWIVPQKATVYEHSHGAFVVNSYLKVMVEEDYMKGVGDGVQGVENQVTSDERQATEILKQAILPIIEKEVNEGQTFANLRQIFNSMILAAWYKQVLKESLLGKVYIDQNKTEGVDHGDLQANQKIYNQYVEAFKKGVYDFIKEDYDPQTQQVMPKHYFSGGVDAALAGVIDRTTDTAQRLNIARRAPTNRDVTVTLNPIQDAQMSSTVDVETIIKDSMDGIASAGGQREVDGALKSGDISMTSKISEKFPTNDQVYKYRTLLAKITNYFGGIYKRDSGEFLESVAIALAQSLNQRSENDLGFEEFVWMVANRRIIDQIRSETIRRRSDRLDAYFEAEMGLRAEGIVRPTVEEIIRYSDYQGEGWTVKTVTEDLLAFRSQVASVINGEGEEEPMGTILDELYSRKRVESDLEQIQIVEELRRKLRAFYYKHNQRLSPRQKYVFKRKYLDKDEPSSLTIAQELGISSAAVYSHLSTARQIFISIAKQKGGPVSPNGKRLREWAESLRGQTIPESQIEIAQRFGVDDSTVSLVFQNFGITSSGVIGRPVDAKTARFEDWAKANRGFKIILSQKKIALIADVAQGTVSRLTREYNILTGRNARLDNERKMASDLSEYYDQWTELISSTKIESEVDEITSDAAMAGVLDRTSVTLTPSQDEQMSAEIRPDQTWSLSEAQEKALVDLKDRVKSDPTYSTNDKAAIDKAISFIQIFRKYKGAKESTGYERLADTLLRIFNHIQYIDNRDTYMDVFTEVWRILEFNKIFGSMIPFLMLYSQSNDDFDRMREIQDWQNSLYESESVQVQFLSKAVSLIRYVGHLRAYGVHTSFPELGDDEDTVLLIDEVQSFREFVVDNMEDPFFKRQVQSSSKEDFPGLIYLDIALWLLVFSADPIVYDDNFRMAKKLYKENDPNAYGHVEQKVRSLSKISNVDPQKQNDLLSLAFRRTSEEWERLGLLSPYKVSLQFYRTALYGLLNAQQGPLLIEDVVLMALIHKADRTGWESNVTEEYVAAVSPPYLWSEETLWKGYPPHYQYYYGHVLAEDYPEIAAVINQNPDQLSREELEKLLKIDQQMSSEGGSVEFANPLARLSDTVFITHPDEEHTVRYLRMVKGIPNTIVLSSDAFPLDPKLKEKLVNSTGVSLNFQTSRFGELSSARFMSDSAIFLGGNCFVCLYRTVRAVANNAYNDGYGEFHAYLPTDGVWTVVNYQFTILEKALEDQGLEFIASEFRKAFGRSEDPLPSFTRVVLKLNDQETIIHEGHPDADQLTIHLIPPQDAQMSAVVTPQNSLSDDVLSRFRQALEKSRAAAEADDVVSFAHKVFGRWAGLLESDLESDLDLDQIAEGKRQSQFAILGKQLNDMWDQEGFTNVYGSLYPNFMLLDSYFNFVNIDKVKIVQDRVKAMSRYAPPRERALALWLRLTKIVYHLRRTGPHAENDIRDNSHWIDNEQLVLTAREYIPLLVELSSDAQLWNEKVIIPADSQKLEVSPTLGDVLLWGLELLRDPLIHDYRLSPATRQGESTHEATVKMGRQRWKTPEGAIALHLLSMVTRLKNSRGQSVEQADIKHLLDMLNQVSVVDGYWTQRGLRNPQEAYTEKSLQHFASLQDFYAQSNRLPGAYTAFAQIFFFAINLRQISIHWTLPRYVGTLHMKQHWIDPTNILFPQIHLNNMRSTKPDTPLQQRKFGEWPVSLDYDVWAQEDYIAHLTGYLPHVDAVDRYLEEISADAQMSADGSEDAPKVNVSQRGAKEKAIRDFEDGYFKGKTPREVAVLTGRRRRSLSTFFSRNPDERKRLGVVSARDPVEQLKNKLTDVYNPRTYVREVRDITDEIDLANRRLGIIALRFTLADGSEWSPKDAFRLVGYLTSVKMSTYSVGGEIVAVVFEGESNRSETAKSFWVKEKKKWKEQGSMDDVEKRIEEAYKKGISYISLTPFLSKSNLLRGGLPAQFSFPSNVRPSTDFFNVKLGRNLSGIDMYARRREGKVIGLEFVGYVHQEGRLTEKKRSYWSIENEQLVYQTLADEISQIYSDHPDFADGNFLLEIGEYLGEHSLKAGVVLRSMPLPNGQIWETPDSMHVGSKLSRVTLEIVKRAGKVLRIIFRGYKLVKGRPVLNKESEFKWNGDKFIFDDQLGHIRAAMTPPADGQNQSDRLDLSRYLGKKKMRYGIIGWNFPLFNGKTWGREKTYLRLGFNLSKVELMYHYDEQGKVVGLTFYGYRFIESKLELISTSYWKREGDGVVYVGPSQDNQMSATTKKEVGGIDLNPNQLDLKKYGEGFTMEIPLELQNIDFESINGFIPVIINITPVPNLPMLLGVAEQQEEPADSAEFRRNDPAIRPQELTYL